MSELSSGECTSTNVAGPVAVIRGIARILEKGCNHRLQRACTKRPIFSRAAPKFG